MNLLHQQYFHQTHSKPFKSKWNLDDISSLLVPNLSWLNHTWPCYPPFWVTLEGSVKDLSAIVMLYPSVIDRSSSSCSC
jgi:hypothetical protein